MPDAERILTAARAIGLSGTFSRFRDAPTFTERLRMEVNGRSAQVAVSDQELACAVDPDALMATAVARLLHRLLDESAYADLVSAMEVLGRDSATALLVGGPHDGTRLRVPVDDWGYPLTSVPLPVATAPMADGAIASYRRGLLNPHTGTWSYRYEGEQP